MVRAAEDRSRRNGAKPLDDAMNRCVVTAENQIRAEIA
jgi:hypothetical protein